MRWAELKLRSGKAPLDATRLTGFSRSTDPERWTNIPLLVKIFKLIINELSTVVEANASRANAADWSQGDYKRFTWRDTCLKDVTSTGPPSRGFHLENNISCFGHQFLSLSDSSGMWEEQEEDDGEDGNGEDEGLAGQLLSDLIASNKYGTAPGFCPFLHLLCIHHPHTRSAHSMRFWICVCPIDDDYYEDDEEDDPDALKDPIYQIDLQVVAFFYRMSYLNLATLSFYSRLWLHIL